MKNEELGVSRPRLGSHRGRMKLCVFEQITTILKVPTVLVCEMQVLGAAL